MFENIERETILIVDDIPQNIFLLERILSSSYDIKKAESGKEALEIVFSDSPPDLILLDIMMPEMSGYEVCRRIVEHEDTKRIPIIFITAKDNHQDETEGFEAGAVDYITKPIRPAIVRARIKTHLALHNRKRLLEKMVYERTQELNTTRLEIIRKLGRAAEYKDNETGLHVIRMSNYSKVIAKNYGLSDGFVELVLNVAPMHDIGKIGIPDSILLKPGKLNNDEWDIMKTHPLIGAEIIGKHQSDLLRYARVAALSHHEKWNGNGYPNGLQGEDIPLIGRIIAIADVFDALTKKRPYKEAWEVDRAINLIKEERGNHFDPELVDIFVDSIDSILGIKVKYGEA